ncbi:transmembrane and TPR repeat-containing protein F38B6.6 [Filimonas sp.]|nr:transmembrane and TPR repeat-containing protein F38B6.6 [Filimonas sp.]
MIEKFLQSFAPYLVMMIFSIALYANTFTHQYALDDEIVISKNEYVLHGIAGMSDIFSKDLFDSFYKQMNTTAQLAGGRYRPLAVASFAIEQEFIGTRQDANFEPDCWDFNHNGKQDIEEDVNRDGNYNDKDLKSKGFGFRHINNTLFYGLSVCILFLFLSTVVFKENKLTAFIISLLFLAHPIHTEVVANVKSRDEIFSFLFIMLSLYLAHQYAAKRTIKYLILTCLSFFAALLSKEYGVVLLLLIPLSLFLFDRDKFVLKKYSGLMLGMIACFAVYYGIRSTIVIGESNLQDAELMNNPFLLADESQKIATKLFIFLKYFITMIYPHPLSSDYGYNSIPYKDFSDFRVWGAIVFLIGCVVALIVSVRKRHWSAFAIAFYLLTILLVTNLIFNIGATMGERLAFHSSLGYCMLLGFALVWIGEKINMKQLSLLFVLPILILYSLKTFSRNKAWENDITLALTDVEIMPESISLNGNASSRNLDLSELPRNKKNEKELIRRAITYGNKAVKLHPGFVNGYLNLGLGYAKIEKYDSAKYVWDIAFNIYPHHPSKPIYYNLLADVYYKNGFKMGALKQWDEGKLLIAKAVELNPTNARYWYDLGGFAYNAQDYAKAKEAWSKAYQLAPNDTTISKVQGLLK